MHLTTEDSRKGPSENNVGIQRRLVIDEKEKKKARFHSVEVLRETLDKNHAKKEEYRAYKKKTNALRNLNYVTRMRNGAFCSKRTLGSNIYMYYDKTLNYEILVGGV